MIIDAVAENKAQVISEHYEYDPVSSSNFSGVRLVGWITQNKDSKYTTLYTKWQRVQFGYHPSSALIREYSAALGGYTVEDAFSLPSSLLDGVYDLTLPKSMTAFQSGSVAYTGNLVVSGYDTTNQFTNTISIEFPLIVDSDVVDPVEPVETVTDVSSYYTIYADGELVYGAGLDDYVVISPRLTLEVNRAGSLTFAIPAGSTMYNKIQKLKTTVEVRQGEEILFRGRLLNTRRLMNNTIECKCEGFLTWLNDIALLPYSFANRQARFLLYDLIDRYNSRASSNRRITNIYSDISKVITVNQQNYSTVWNEISKTLLENVGGYIVPYLTAQNTGLKWVSEYGNQTTQAIEFGQNLLDFEEFIDASQVFNAVRPFGKKINGVRLRLTDDEGFVYDQTSINMFGRIERNVVFDEIEDLSELREAGLVYLRNGLSAAMTIKMNAFDLSIIDKSYEKIRIGDAVRAISQPHQIDAFFLCTKMDIVMDHPKDTIYTFGATEQTISQLTDKSYNPYVITEGV